VSFPRFLAVGAIVSLALHGSGSAFFAKDPDEVSVAASEGGGVSVIGSIEDLVAGAQMDLVSETEPLEEIVPEIAPEREPVKPVSEPVKLTEVTPAVSVKPVEAVPVQPATEQAPVETARSSAAVPIVEGVTTTDPVTSSEPVETVLSHITPPVPSVAPVEPAAPLPEIAEKAKPAAPVQPIVPVEAEESAKPAEKRPEPKPVEIAKVSPAVTAEPIKPVTQDPEAQQPIEDPIADVTQTPRTKPKPPVRKTEPKKTPDRKVKTAQTKGAESSSRKGGEQVTSKTARSNANGAKNVKSRDGGVKATSNYKGKVASKLRRAKRYPREARRKNLEGTARVAFTITRSGAVSGIRLARSSGHALLDRAALEMVRRAAPMPKFPSEITVARMSLQVPVRFNR